ncbi:hypothetical protein niasHT_020267 [Heterodera trifolii]|uniref:Uncharacterized protein n=1 Tax=Heterodera trifolii TaxID=157864 RepID=A0ABD2KSM3_9BILA
MNSSEATTENVGLGGNKDERQTTSKDQTDESNSENQRNEQRQRQMDSEKEDSRSKICRVVNCKESAGES